MSPRPYPTKMDASDEETVDSFSDSLHGPDSNVPMPESKPADSSDEKKKKKKRARLTVISKKYDLDGDGVLDEAEQAMRDRDVAGRGFLTNDEIYDIVQEELRAKKSAGYMKRLIAGLICFVVLLAMSNLATSWASATLARDMKADDGGKDEEGVSKEVPAVKISSTGEIAGAQTVGDTYEAVEMTDEELDYRRRLVLEEIEEDPHSHAHRRLGDRCHSMDKSGCGRNKKVTFDSDIIPGRQFDEIQSKCASQRTVNIKRSWGDGGNKNSRNDCLCSRGTSIVVKEKKGKKKGGGGGGGNKNKKNGGGGNKNKKNGDNKKKKGGNNKKGKDKVRVVKNREVIFEKENGDKWHADCEDDLCYVGGKTFQGDHGDDCLLNADQCQSGLVCEAKNDDKPASFRGGGRNNKSRYGFCVKVSKTSTVVVKFQKRGGFCNRDNGWDACDNGYYCEPDDLDQYWGVLSTRSGGRGRGGGGHNVGDCSNDRGSCAAGYRCTKSPLNGSDRWNCMAGDDDFDYAVQFRSSSTKYRGDGVGTCVKYVGAGQTCFDDYWCGNGNRCDGGVCARGGQKKVVVNVSVKQKQNQSYNGRPIYGNEDCTNNRGGCAAGYTCRPSTINGSDRWTCQ